MKKIFLLVFLSFFLVSCGQNSENSTEKTTEAMTENIAKVCSSIEKDESFENVKNTFGEPKLLSETFENATYYYGDYTKESCTFLVEDEKIIIKNYIKI